MSGKTRQEKDSFGTIDVPAERYWGAQTQRSLENFPIGTERMPLPLVRGLGLVKQSAALANKSLDNLDADLAKAIAEAAGEVADGKWNDEFPLVVWQTGSGTQSNMNANEVIANRASELLGGSIGMDRLVHPNDHVNRAQSSNDTFPTAMHIAVCEQTHHHLIPALEHLWAALDKKAAVWDGLIKIGRTHAQDAVPLSLGQEFSGYAAQLQAVLKSVHDGLPALYQLPQGGTAIGTGLNAPQGFDRAVCAEIAALTGLPFEEMENKFAGIAAHDAFISFSGVLNTLAAALLKIGNDIRLLGAGPRAGLGELKLPQNEPGSSIMPGKVNPTQVEALTMVCTQVMGNHTAITIAGSQGQFELNAYKPVMAHALLQSIRLLGDAMRSFTDRCVAGIEPDEARIRELVERSLMLVTALAPEIGYDNAAEIAHHAFEHGQSLREAALDLGHVDEATFDRIVDAAAMAHPHRGNRGGKAG